MKSKVFNVENVRALEFLLRIGVFMEFLGHGAFGLITKAAWVPYITVFGFSEAIAWKLMPVIGGIDIFILGLSALLLPVPAVILYMSFWGLFTAFLRPLTGEGIWEFVERAYNFGVPFALFYVYRGATANCKFFRVNKPEGSFLTARHTRALINICKFVLAGMLIGHGAIGVFYEKKIFITLYKSIGVPEDTLQIFKLYVGYFEILLGILCLFVENIYFVLFIFLWKVLTEGIYFIAPVKGGYFEFMERGGSYTAPLAMIFLLLWLKKSHQNT